MQRREFILTLLGGTAVAWPLAAHAQQPGKVYRIGFLWDSPDAFVDALEAFRQGLRELGYVEGRTIAIEYRWAEGKPERMRELAEELVQLKVDVIVAPSSIYTAAAKRATSTIPIIFMATVDALREMAHEVYTRARLNLDPLTRRRLFRQADNYLKQADELRRGDVVQAVFPEPDTFPKPDRNVG